MNYLAHLVLSGDDDEVIFYKNIQDLSKKLTYYKKNNSFRIKIAKKGPEFIARGKHLFYSQIEKGLESAYSEATHFMVDHFKLKSTQSGLKAFLNKKPMPDWFEADD